MLHYHHYHHYLHLHLHHFYHQNPTSLAEAQSEAQFVTLWNCPSTRLRTHSISQKHPKWLQIIVSVHLANSSSLHFSLCDFFLVYYRIYAEDGAIPSKTPVSPNDPFLGRIKAISVPPPHTAKAVKFSIAKVENIKDRTNTSLYLSPYGQSPMSDSEKVSILNRSGLGSTPQEPLAIVAKMPDSERSKMESEGGGELASPVESDTTTTEIRYCKSVQHSPTFLFILTISTIGKSALSALRWWLWNVI